LETIEKYPIDLQTLEKGFDAQGVRQIYKDLVIKHPSVADENPKLTVPQKIEIKKVAGFSEEQFKRKLLNYLYSQCANCEITLNPIKIPAVPKNGVVAWSDIKLAASILVPVSEHFVAVTAKIKKNVIVAKRNMMFNERISEEDFENKFMDVTFAKEEPLTIEELKSYQKTARPVMKGKAVFPSDLKREPAAERGKTVKIIIGDSDFEVTLAGVAEETGHVGDTIKVKNSENKKIFSAVIVDKGVVRIQ
jgi:flagella basal body P-ring formation protein FlgA